MTEVFRTDRRGLLAGASALAAIALTPTVPRAAIASPALSAQVRARGPGSPLVHYWSTCVGAGRANEGLRAAWLEQLQQVRQACGFQYCRFHGLFHDDMFVLTLVDGKPVYNWQYVDELLDRMLAIGVKPFVELGFMPKDLASTDKTQFWWKGHVSPPKDFALWADLVSAFARHCLERYGAQEVRSWWFEVWNEPNLRGFWDGTRSQYFELYKTSALALKAVDPALRVGGPATSNFVGDARFDGDVEDKSQQRTNTVEDLDSLPWRGVWIEAFLAYCAAEKLPVDFVSAHPYPTDFALNPGTGKNKGRTRKVDATLQDLTWLRDTVQASAFPSAQIHLTEWSSSPTSRDATHDYLQAAAYIIKVNLDCIGLADSLSYWTFTDVFEEAGAGRTAFHGGFGLVTYQGVAKPSFHAYRMLHALGDQILHRQDGLIVTRRGADGKRAALAYNFPQQVTTALSFGDRDDAEALYARGTARDVRLVLDDLAPGATFELDILDGTHGNAIAAWDTMGRPASPTREQIDALRQAGLATLKRVVRADAAGRLTWSRSLAPWSCVLLREI